MATATDPLLDLSASAPARKNEWDYWEDWANRTRSAWSTYEEDLAAEAAFKDQQAKWQKQKSAWDQVWFPGKTIASLFGYDPVGAAPTAPQYGSAPATYPKATTKSSGPGLGILSALANMLLAPYKSTASAETSTTPAPTAPSLAKPPSREDFGSDEEYQAALGTWARQADVTKAFESELGPFNPNEYDSRMANVLEAFNRDYTAAEGTRERQLAELVSLYEATNKGWGESIEGYKEGMNAAYGGGIDKFLAALKGDQDTDLADLATAFSERRDELGTAFGEREIQNLLTLMGQREEQSSGLKAIQDMLAQGRTDTQQLAEGSRGSVELAYQNTLKRFDELDRMYQEGLNALSQSERDTLANMESTVAAEMDTTRRGIVTNLATGLQETASRLQQMGYSPDSPQYQAAMSQQLHASNVEMGQMYNRAWTSFQARQTETRTEFANIQSVFRTNAMQSKAYGLQSVAQAGDTYSKTMSTISNWEASELNQLSIWSGDATSKLHTWFGDKLGDYASRGDDMTAEYQRQLTATLSEEYKMRDQIRGTFNRAVGEAQVNWSQHQGAITSLAMMAQDELATMYQDIIATDTPIYTFDAAMTFLGIQESLKANDFQMINEMLGTFFEGGRFFAQLFELGGFKQKTPKTSSFSSPLFGYSSTE